MLRDLTIRIVKFWCCWDVCTGLRETSRAAETTAQAQLETSYHILTVVLSVPQRRAISYIIFVFVVVIKFTAS